MLLSFWRLLEFIFFLLILLALISIVIFSVKNGISPTPTSRKVKKKLLAALPGTIDGPIYELGAGWGSLAFPLANKYPLCRVEAFENSLIPYWFCKIRLWIFPKANLKFHRQNFFDVSLREASLVVCYLYPGAMQRLKVKFQEELPLSANVVSNTFAVSGWKPIRVINVLDLYNSKIYFY